MSTFNAAQMTSAKGTMAKVLCPVVLLTALVGCGGGGSSTTTSTGGGGNPTSVSITTQPASTTVQEQKTAQFQVQAAGGSNLTYQWQKNNTAISGATQSSYSYGPAQLADSGASFTVVVSNGSSTVTSSPAVLSVTPAPLAVTASSATVAPLGTFTLTGTRTTPTAGTGVDAVKEQYSLEYTFTSGTVVYVPVNLQSDGSIVGVAPPGTISGGQIQPGSVLVRVRRVLQTSASSKPATDFSNSFALTVSPPPTLSTAPGYATQLLLLIGKYLIADATTHSNGFMDATTSQMLTSFDFNTQAANVVASLDPPTLALVDSLSASTILTAYQYDLSTGTFTSAAARLSGRGPARIRTSAPRTRPDDAIDDLASSIATNFQSFGADIRNLGNKLNTVGEVLGVGVAIAGAVAGAPAIIAAGTGVAMFSYVATMTTTAMSAGVDMAATFADPSSSSTPESNFQAILPSLNYFATNTLSSTLQILFNPLDGEVDEWMKENLPSQLYDAYQVASPFIYSFADPISEKINSYSDSLLTSDTTTPPDDEATFDADLEATSATPVDDAIDTSAINQPTDPASGGTLSSLDAQLEADINELQSLDNLLGMVSSLPGNQSASALQSFSSCSSGFVTDFENLANEISAGGPNPTDQQLAAWVAEFTTDTQGIVNCGAALGTSLSQASPNASSTQTRTSGTDQVTVTAANCDSSGAGCWITEETKHSDGTSSTETGYVACQKSGFCPMYLH